MKNLIAKTLLIGGLAGSLGIFGNANGQVLDGVYIKPQPQEQDTCERLQLEFLLKILDSYDSTKKENGNKIYHDFLSNQNMHVLYIEDVPYTACSGKKSFLNMLRIERYRPRFANKDEFVTQVFIDSEKDTISHMWKENLPKTETKEYFFGEGLDARVEYFFELGDKPESRIIKKIPKYEEIAKYSEFYDIKEIDKYSQLYNDIRELIINEKNKQLTNKK